MVSYAFWKSSFSKTPAFLFLLSLLTISFAINAPSRICFPLTKAVWVYPIRLGSTCLSLLLRILAIILYALPTKLIGLKSTTSSDPFFLGINVTHVVLILGWKEAVSKNYLTYWIKSSPTICQTFLKHFKLKPSYPGAFKGSQLRKASLISTSETTTSIEPASDGDSILRPGVEILKSEGSCFL